MPVTIPVLTPEEELYIVNIANRMKHAMLEKKTIHFFTVFFDEGRMWIGDCRHMKLVE